MPLVHGHLNRVPASYMPLSQAQTGKLAQLVTSDMPDVLQVLRSWRRTAHRRAGNKQAVLRLTAHKQQQLRAASFSAWAEVSQHSSMLRRKVAEHLLGQSRQSQGSAFAEWRAWAQFRVASARKVAAAVARLRCGSLAGTFQTWRDQVLWRQAAQSKMQVGASLSQLNATLLGAQAGLVITCSQLQTAVLGLASGWVSQACFCLLLHVSCCWPSGPIPCCHSVCLNLVSICAGLAGQAAGRTCCSSFQHLEV